MESTKALALHERAADEPLIPQPWIYFVTLLALANHVIFGPRPIYPVNPFVTYMGAAPGDNPAADAAGTDRLMALIDRQANAGFVRQVTITNSIIVNGRAWFYVVTFEPVPGLTWPQIFERAGGRDAVYQFINNDIRDALRNGVGSRETIMTAELAASIPGQEPVGVPMAILHWYIRPNLN